MVKVMVNGKTTEIAGNTSIVDLINSLGLKPEMVIVDLNERVVSRDLWKSTLLGEADRLELVSFVGGG